MKHTYISPPGMNVRIRLSSFERPGGGEYHAVIEGTDAMSNAPEQYAGIACGLEYIVSRLLPPGAVPVLKRWFVSDAANHEVPHPDGEPESAAVSIVGQPPLNGTKVSLWCWFMEGACVTRDDGGSVVAGRPAYSHLFDTGLHSHATDEEAQTDDIFRQYAGRLGRQGGTLAGDTIRTWIFVQGVDTHYGGMARARKRLFERHGLTERSHYIASTGIEGRHKLPETTVFADMYAVRGLRDGQITWLKGATHLNPTHEYGVTFERGTAVDYGDRRHVFISGTASIDNRGQIVHPFDVMAQTRRTLENVGVLLDEGGASPADVACMIVYLRDPADHGVVSAYLDRHCPDIPRVVLWAPVCRPGWLVEIECIAIAEAANEAFPIF